MKFPSRFDIDMLRYTCICIYTYIHICVYIVHIFYVCMCICICMRAFMCMWFFGMCTCMCVGYVYIYTVYILVVFRLVFVGSKALFGAGACEQHGEDGLGGFELFRVQDTRASE